MATLELSAGFVGTGTGTSSLLGRIAMVSGDGQGTTSNDDNYPNSGLLYQGENNLYATSNISLYSGTVPTSWISTPYTTYESNLLIRWYPNTHYSVTTGNVTISGNILNIASLYTTAAASGTATWCMVWSHRGDFTAASLNIPLQQIIGTVGLPGSGADLLVGDTAIVAGKNYRISNFRIQLPTSWTY